MSDKGVLIYTLHQRTDTSILVKGPIRDENISISMYGEYYSNHALNINDAISHLMKSIAG